MNESWSSVLKEERLEKITFRPDIEGIEKKECIQERGVDVIMTDDFAWAI